MGEKVRFIIVAVLVAVHAASGTPDFFLGDGHYWLRALSYSFFHASWWHLAVNCLAVLTIYRRRCRPWQDLIIPFIIAILVYPLSFRPVIGFSNVLYACLGLRTPPLNSKWWTQTNVVVFLVVTVALVFVPRFSATTHIAAFVLGMCGAAIHRGWLKLTEDARRYL